MKFVVSELNKNIVDTMRSLGYHSDRKPGSFSRRLRSTVYPKYHIYVEELGDKWSISLHLDQKPASYLGHRAHSGEYNGEALEQEKRRILANLNQ